MLLGFPPGPGPIGVCDPGEGAFGKYFAVLCLRHSGRLVSTDGGGPEGGGRYSPRRFESFPLRLCIFPAKAGPLPLFTDLPTSLCWQKTRRVYSLLILPVVLAYA